jgi:hypothetical protein
MCAEIVSIFPACLSVNLRQHWPVAVSSVLKLSGKMRGNTRTFESSNIRPEVTTGNNLPPIGGGDYFGYRKQPKTVIPVNFG